MKREYTTELSAVVGGAILAIFCVLSFLSIHVISAAYSQGQAASLKPDEIKAMLLKPNGWIAYWGTPVLIKSSDDPYPNQVECIFEARGENVVVKLDYIKGWFQIKTCERDVKISPNVVEWISCHDNRVTLHFDPNDHVYPFKGGNTVNNVIWLKAK